MRTSFVRGTGSDQLRHGYDRGCHYFKLRVYGAETDHCVHIELEVFDDQEKEHFDTMVMCTSGSMGKHYKDEFG